MTTELKYRYIIHAKRYHASRYRPRPLEESSFTPAGSKRGRSLSPPPAPPSSPVRSPSPSEMASFPPVHLHPHDPPPVSHSPLIPDTLPFTCLWTLESADSSEVDRLYGGARGNPHILELDVSGRFIDIESSRMTICANYPELHSTMDEVLPINEHGVIKRVSISATDRHLVDTLATIYGCDCDGLFFTSSREYVVFPGSIPTCVAVVSHRRSTYPPEARPGKKMILQ